MAKHEDLVAEIAAQCDRLLTRADQLKRYMVISAALAQSDPKSLYFLTVESRGAAIVGICAELEALTRTILQRSHEEINESSIPYSQMSASLRQLAAHETFESLRSLRDHSRLWDRRAHATTLEFCNDFVKLPIERRHAQPPLDGRTLKPEHFYRIWAIYNLPGEAFPVVGWAASLQKVALLRNDIAHGNVAFADVFKQAGTSMREIEAYLDDLSHFSIHVAIQWQEYLSVGGYLLNS
ncbi:HEPN domain-containing protein [Actinosynnema sp. NPDC047251]|uniref:HEPN domain-containing protein n=1 Tax=Saccharothrix espanaensis TaxID=103731 RepID=UPI0011DCD042|nr:HEPN domain-containing protein [Saccharothrix espanaensis]